MQQKGKKTDGAGALWSEQTPLWFFWGELGVAAAGGGDTEKAAGVWGGEMLEVCTGLKTGFYGDWGAEKQRDAPRFAGRIG